MVQSWPQCSCPPNVPHVQGESHSVLLKFLVIQTSNNRNIWAERIFESCRWFSCVGNCPLCIYVIRKVSFICLWLSEASNKKHIHVPIPSSSQQHRRREKIINCYVSQVKRTHSLSVRPHVYQWELFPGFYAAHPELTHPAGWRKCYPNACCPVHKESCWDGRSIVLVVFRGTPNPHWTWHLPKTD